MKQTGIITSNRFKQHLTGAGHPESPARIQAIHHALHRSGLLDTFPVEVPETQYSDLPEQVHTTEYQKRVENACKKGEPFIDTYDNPISTDSYETALLAANAVVHGITRVIENDWKNCLTVVRPPGHHAEESMAMGFCLFNNVAIGARYLQNEFGLDRIAIVDFDVHHGNGTQHLFEADPTVFYASIHQSPFYPGTGERSETGTGKGRGYTVNYPLPAGTAEDRYLDILENDLSDRLLRFDPDFLILSAGFDGHIQDPVGQMNISTEGYYDISRKLITISEECCDGKLVSVLEGGYHLDALGESVKVHLMALSGKQQ